MSKSREEFTNSFQNLLPTKPLKISKSPGLKAPQTEIPRIEPSQIQPSHNEMPQNEISRSEQPHFEKAVFSGYFKLSHDVFFDAMLRDLSGDEFRLFLWMSMQGWRYPDSDGFVRAAVSYIVSGTGISHASVSRALNTLRNSNLIELVETDYKKGNLWKVCSKLRVLDPTPGRKPHQNEEPQNEISQSEKPSTSKRDRGSLDLRQPPPQSEAEIRNSITPKIQKTLSQEIPEWVSRYLISVLAPAKRESERKAYLNLLGSIADGDLFECFELVRLKGELGSGKPVHSPMAYLGHALQEVLRTVQLSSQKKKKSLVHSIPDYQIDNEQAVEQTNLAIREFEAAFHSQEEKKQFIDNYVRLELSGIRPPELTVLRLAATDWFNDSRGTGKAK